MQLTPRPAFVSTEAASQLATDYGLSGERYRVFGTRCCGACVVRPFGGICSGEGDVFRSECTVRSVRVAPIDVRNWGSALGVRVSPEQLPFVADHQPVALVILAKAYVRPGDCAWEPLAFVDEAGDVVGVVALVHQVDSCQIRHFAIDSRYQNRGIGGLAMSAIVEHLERGRPSCRRLLLSFHPENAPARRLYSRAGFVDTGEKRFGEPVWAFELLQQPDV